MKDIIGDAQKSRFTVSDDDPKKKGIAISDAWMAELEKHPYHSSKIFEITYVEKPGTAIFLMKESSKLYRPHKEREQRKLLKRLGGPAIEASDARHTTGAQSKRQNLGSGQFAEVPPPKQGDTMMKSGAK